jgi:hypothetical protein
MEEDEKRRDWMCKDKINISLRTVDFMALYFQLAYFFFFIASLSRRMLS